MASLLWTIVIDKDTEFLVVNEEKQETSLKQLFSFNTATLQSHHQYLLSWVLFILHTLPPKSTINQQINPDVIQV